MLKALIIEDELGLRITLEDRLISEGYEVTVKSDGISGEEAALSGEFDIILLDIMLPGRDGYKVCDNLRTAGISTPIIMTTARNTDLDTIIGFRQGADDYVAKPFDMSVLLARIDAILRRSMSSVKPSKNCKIFEFGNFKLDCEAGELYDDNSPVHLNVQEFKLLEYLLLNNNKIITRDTMLDDVWEYDNDTSSRTVDVHIAKLRHKLGESDTPKHIKTIRGRGYKFLI